MSRLLVVTSPALAPGFQLAGVEAYGAEDAESAQNLIGPWLDAGEAALLAIDERLLEHMERAFIERLQAADHLPYLPIPGSEPIGKGISRRHHIEEMIRRAIGFKVTLKGEPTEVNK